MIEHCKRQHWKLIVDDTLWAARRPFNPMFGTTMEKRRNGWDRKTIYLPKIGYKVRWMIRMMSLGLQRHCVSFVKQGNNQLNEVMLNFNYYGTEESGMDKFLSGTTWAGGYIRQCFQLKFNKVTEKIGWWKFYEQNLRKKFYSLKHCSLPFVFCLKLNCTTRNQGKA